MHSGHINRVQSNIDKSYILKSKKDIEKYVTRLRNGTLALSTLTEAMIFPERESAEDMAQMLNKDNYQVEVLEIQDRSRW